MSSAGSLTEIFSSIQGEGPLVGYRQLFIRLGGCNISCFYCDTGSEAGDWCRIEDAPGSRSFRTVRNPVQTDLVVRTASEWSDGWPGIHHSISLTGGEPLLQVDFLSALLPQLARLHPLFLETNGTLPDSLHRLIHLLTYVSMDIKLPSVSGCTDLWDTHRNFLAVAAQREVFVKAVVGRETEEWEIEKAAGIVAAVDPSIQFILQPVTENNIPSVPSNRLLFFQEIAASMLRNVRVVPQTHLFLQGMI